MAAYEFDPSRQSDDGFEPGCLALLVVGNTARMLDPRRTPVQVVGLRTDLGLVRLSIAAFEDKGAIWDLPAERVDRFQFPRSSPRLAERTVAELARVVARFNRLERRQRNRQRLPETLERLAEFTVGAHSLWDDATPLISVADERTDEVLAATAALWWRRHGIAGLESNFARVWASNPGSDETVTASLLVLAGLGLVDYSGPMLRDPTRLEGAESIERREIHILSRLGFIRAMFAEAGVESFTLYRGYGLTDAWNPAKRPSLVSATADRTVAQSHFESATPRGLLQRETIAIDRVFMTWLETPQLSSPYRESEVVLLGRKRRTSLF